MNEKVTFFYKQNLYFFTFFSRWMKLTQNKNTTGTYLYLMNVAEQLVSVLFFHLFIQRKIQKYFNPDPGRCDVYDFLNFEHIYSNSTKP